MNMLSKPGYMPLDQLTPEQKDAIRLDRVKSGSKPVLLGGGSNYTQSKPSVLMGK